MQERQEDMISTLTVFYSYAHEDERLCKKLETHLSLLRKQGIIAEWHNRKVVPGSDWSQEADVNLNNASVILLLVSPDFLASEYCYGIEMQRALERHRIGEAKVIPIILRPVDWEGAPFAHLQCLPHDARAVTEWDNRDAAFREVARGIRIAVEQISATSNHSQRTVSTPGISGTVRTHTPTILIDHNRQRMLKRVRSTWIAGVLEQSLHGAMLMELGLEEMTDVLDNPWRMLMQEVDKPAQALPAGTHITKVYDETEGGLLILGGPGAGKTTLLLDLTRDLLVRAESNESSPIPVVFNLSSWSEKRSILSEWIVEELSIRYEVPRRLGQSWVSEDRLLLLLDGLDEVAPTARKECIDSINNFRQKHPLVHVIVCSRITDYLNQTRQLRLQAAVVIQPLTQEQIDAYLDRLGERADALREALDKDVDLRELATSPLMLTILMFALGGNSLDKISSLASLEAKREQVLATYVQHMLKRRGISKRYSPQQIKHWLTYLAQQMKQQSQTVFYIEQMQPYWLLKQRQRYLYQALSGAILGGLLGGLIAWPAFYLFRRFFPFLPYFLDPVSETLAGLVIGSLIVLVISLLRLKSMTIRTSEVITWSKTNAFRAFTVALVSGSFGALIAEFLSENHYISYSLFYLIDLMIALLVGGIFSVLITGFLRRKKHKHALITANRGIWYAVGRGMLIGFITAGLIFVVDQWQLSRYFFIFVAYNSNIFLYVYIIVLACISGIIVGLLFSVSTSQLETRNFLKPNQGIWRSANNGGRVLLSVGLMVSLIYGLGEIVRESSYGIGIFVVEQLITGAILGLMVGAFFGLLNGGMTCFKHILLRSFLVNARDIPWNYVHFLDYAAERVLLRKVGGGYIFLHRLLLDYFASLEAAPTSQKALISNH